MTIDKAIKELDKELSIWSPIIHPNLRDSVKLGIEALKRLEVIRKSWPCYTSELLPGETEDLINVIKA